MRGIGLTRFRKGLPSRAMAKHAPWIVLAIVTLNACGESTSPVAPQRADAAPTAGSGLSPSAAPALASSPLPPSDHSLVGRYAMTLELGRSCDLPEEARVRRYSASIAGHGPEALLVTLGSGTFLQGTICTAGGGRVAGVGCNQFFASSNAGTAHLALENHNDDAHGSHIVERLPSGSWVEIIGSTSGAITGDPTIRTKGTATVWYCPTDSGYPFPCSSPTGCTSEMDITLTRD